MDNNFLIWQGIKQIIKTLNLTVTLTKVKAHSNDPHNDEADELAKNGRSIQTKSSDINMAIKYISNNRLNQTEKPK
ncbi:hypothetical protein C1646_763429 [Rhizophagus diaphanus]|nr:hypothetical protein C1646_763429 [Rhizophagus diaphanus] [Rhizophagus sp. MUCL 43196]